MSGLGVLLGSNYLAVHPERVEGRTASLHTVWRSEESFFFQPQLLAALTSGTRLQT
jgi:hypothetical protein